MLLELIASSQRLPPLKANGAGHRANREKDGRATERERERGKDRDATEVAKWEGQRKRVKKRSAKKSRRGGGEELRDERITVVARTGILTGRGDYKMLE